MSARNRWFNTADGLFWNIGAAIGALLLLAQALGLIDMARW